MRCAEGVMSGSIDQAGVPCGRNRISLFRQRGSQTAAGRITDPHVLDHFRRMNATLFEIADRFLVTMQLDTIELSGGEHCRSHAIAAVQQSQSLRECRLMIQFGEANDITTAAASVTVEQALVVVQQKARFVIWMQRTQSHPSAPAQSASRPPVMRLQIIQQRDSPLQLVDSLAIHGLLASMSRIRPTVPRSQTKMVGGRRN